MKIGVSIFCPASGLSVWTNGAHQNCFFLAALLRRFADVVLVNGGDGDPPPVEHLPPEVHNITFAKMADVRDALDVIIQCGAQLEASDIADVRARGGKAIAYKFGSDFPIDAERAIHNLPSGGIFNGAVFDEVWTTSQHEATCGSYWETCYRCPVRVLPHIWEPWFVDLRSRELAAIGIKTGYIPGRAKKRIVIAEPNINLIKTCHIPMVIVERAWRERPDLIDMAMVTNSIDMKTRPAFSHFAASLDICKAPHPEGGNVMSFEARYNTPWFMAVHGDVVVSHQWIVAANYHHYDVLHLGYPLVHNVPEMTEYLAGYYYNAFDANEGCGALLMALEESDADYRDRSRHERRFLSTRSIDRTVDRHQAALAEMGTA